MQFPFLCVLRAGTKARPSVVNMSDSCPLSPESGHRRTQRAGPLCAESRLVAWVRGTNAGIDKLMRRGVLGVRMCSFARQDVPASCIRFLPQRCGYPETFG